MIKYINFIPVVNFSAIEFTGSEIIILTIVKGCKKIMIYLYIVIIPTIAEHTGFALRIGDAVMQC